MLSSEISVWSELATPSSTGGKSKLSARTRRGEPRTIPDDVLNDRCVYNQEVRCGVNSMMCANCQKAAGELV
jgi:hypothetical protein